MNDIAQLQGTKSGGKSSLPEADTRAYQGLPVFIPASRFEIVRTNSSLGMTVRTRSLSIHTENDRLGDSAIKGIRELKLIFFAVMAGMDGVSLCRGRFLALESSQTFDMCKHFFIKINDEIT